MKNLRKFAKKSKEYQNIISLKEEKITIINQNTLYIQNYHELIEITDHKITLRNLSITGRNLKITTISKYFIEITGQFSSVQFMGV